MPSPLLLIVGVVVGALVGALVAYLWVGNRNRERDLVSNAEREKLLSDAETQMKELEIGRTRERVNDALAEQVKELERISGMTRAEARTTILTNLEKELNQEIAQKIRDGEAIVKEESEKRARNILVTAMQRVAAEQTAETSVSVVAIPSDEMKGRIIGREGRNIRALEHATGVDLIIDDTPEAVILSGFDPV